MRGKVVISFLAAVSASLLFYYLGQILFSSNHVNAVGFSLFLGFITWTGIEKLLAKHSNRRDDSDLFPLLKRDALEKWGKKCGEQYRNLNKIVLYDAPMRYPIDSRYILLYDFDTSTPEGEKEEEIFNETNAFQINTILGPEFKEVYRNEPGSNFTDEWFLSIVKYSGFNDKYSWIIYQREKQGHLN